MRPIGRFVLVATAVTGGLVWGSIPSHAPYGRYYAFFGLVAAVVSAAVPRGPRIAEYLLGRVVLAGCVTLGLLSFIAIGHHDLAGTITMRGAALLIAVVLWPASVGIVTKLVIPRCHTWTIYSGFVLASASVACVAPHRHGLPGLLVGVSFLGLIPALTAALTGAVQRGLAARDRADLPDARVVE